MQNTVNYMELVELAASLTYQDIKQGKTFFIEEFANEVRHYVEFYDLDAMEACEAYARVIEKNTSEKVTIEPGQLAARIKAAY